MGKKFPSLFLIFHLYLKKKNRSDVPPITLDCATTLRNLSLVENIDNKTEVNQDKSRVVEWNVQI